MPDPLSKHAPDLYPMLSRRVREAFAGPNGLHAPAANLLLSEMDYSAIRAFFGDAGPTRILDVGGGAGASLLLLTLAFPHARGVAIDPNEPSVHDAGSAGQRTAASVPLAVAEAAAMRLGVASRISFFTGAFAASSSRGARVVGPQITAAEPEFDLILLEAPSDPDNRSADLRLAASALAPSGVIAIRGVTGPMGARVRAGVFDFLRYNYNPAFNYMHAPFADGQDSLGFLRRRSAGWFPGVEPPQPTGPESVPQAVRISLAEQVALIFGGRPLIEVAVGAPTLGVTERAGASRVLKLAAADVSARFSDPVINRIFEALDQNPGAALFSADLLDFANDEFVARFFAGLGDRTPALLAITPPGEAGIAGPASRPAARVIDLALGQSLSAYGSVGSEDQPAARAFQRGAATTSRYLSLLVFAARGGWRDAGGRSLLEIAPIAAAQREQAELQKIQAQAALYARRVDPHPPTPNEKLRGDLADRLDATRLAVEAARLEQQKLIEAHAAETMRLRAELREQAESGLALQTRLRAAEIALDRERQRQRDADADFAARLREEAESLRSTTQALQMAEAALLRERQRHQETEADLAARWGQQTDELRSLQAELQVAETTYGRERERHDEVEADLAARWRQQADEIRSLQAALQSAESAHARERSRHHELETELNRVREEAEAARTLQASLQAAESSLHRERQLRQATEVDFSDRLRAAETALLEHRARLDQAGKRESAAQAMLADLRSQLEARNAALAESAARTESLASERSNLENQLRGLMESMEQARGQLESLSAEATKTRADIQVVRESELAARTERDGLERQLVFARNRIDELTAQRASKATETERQSQQIAAANARIASLESAQQSTRSTHESALTSLRSEATSLRDHHSRLQNEVLKLRSDNDGARRTIAQLNTELAALHDKLNLAHNDVVASAVREMDARLKLDGIDAHLALSQRALDLYRADPARFRSAALPYPSATDATLAAKAAPAELVETAKTLHGRAADVSRDLVETLEEAGKRKPESEFGLSARLKANELSHEQAIANLRKEFAERLTRAEQAAQGADELDSRAASLENVTDRIELSLAKTTPVEATTVEPLSPKLDPRAHASARLAALGLRLERVLHLLEAGGGFGSGPLRPNPTEGAKSTPLSQTSPGPKDFGNPTPVAPPTARSAAQRIASDSAPTLPVVNDGERRRSRFERTQHWLETYPETFRLTRRLRDLRSHFQSRGLKPRIFDAAYYLKQGPIGDHSNAWRHYLLVGEAQGRRPVPGFDPAYYRRQLGGASPRTGSLLGHFLMVGAGQGVAPCSELENLPGLAKAAGVSPLEYFFRWRPSEPPRTDETG